MAERRFRSPKRRDMSTLVCSRQLVPHLPGAVDVRALEELLPDLSGIWTLGDPEPALAGAAALVSDDAGLPEFAAWASARGAVALIGCGVEPGGFALDTLPAHLSLIAWPGGSTNVSEARFRVQDALLRAQREQLERSRVTHERLTRVAVEGHGLDELATTLATLVGASAIVKDRDHRNLATASAEIEHDSVRRRSLALGATTSDVIEILERDGTFDLLRSERRPIHVKPRPELEMNARVMAPVIMGDAYYGYISVARGERALERIDLIAVEHAATVAALIIGREQAVRARERNLRTSFVYESIFGHEPRDVMERRARYLGYDPAEGHAVLVVRARATPSESLRALMEHIAVALDEAIASEAGRFGLSTIVADDVAVALLPARERGAPLAWRTRTDRLLRGVFAVSASLELTAGVGRWYAERDGLRRSFAEARLAATIGSHVGGARSVTLYERLGVYRLLASVVDRGALAEFRAEQLGPIADDADLLATLRAYLNARGNKALCAKALYVHLNTVKYRLRRIADLAGRDLDDAQELLNLHVALEIGDILPLLGTIPSP